MSVYTIKKYLEMVKTPYSRSEEIIYQFYRRMPDGSRIAGCEVFLRSAGDDTYITVELPVNIMSRESFGVAKYLAQLNQERGKEEKMGYFMLDYVKHKIIFALPPAVVPDENVLESAILYALRQIDFEIEEIIRVVCEEGDRIFKEDEERRKQQEMEERGPGVFSQMIHKLLDKLGLVDDGEPDDIPDYNDFDDEDEPDFTEAEPESERREPEEAEEEESVAEEAPAPRREPEFEEILKILGIDTDKERTDAADEPAEAEAPAEERSAGEEAPAGAAEEAAAPAEEPKKEEPPHKALPNIP